MSNTWYTKPVISESGEKIMGCVYNTDDGFNVRVLANGVVLDGGRWVSKIRNAQKIAREMVQAEVERVNAEYHAMTDEPAAVDMGGDIEALAEALADDELDAEFAASMGIDAEPQTAIDEGDFMEGYIARKITANNKQGNRPSVPSIHAEQDAQIARQNGTETKNQRIKRLEKRIASQERELIDLRFELSQLLEGEV